MIAGMPIHCNSAAEPKWTARFSVRLMLGVVLLNLLVILLAGLSIRQNYQTHQEAAEITTQNLTRLLENDLVGIVHTDNVIIASVLDEYLRQRAAGKIDARVLNGYIERARQRAPGMDALRVTDASGLLVYGSGVDPAARISLADRPHFIRLRDDPQAGLVFSKPQISRVNNKWVIVLARRIDQADGSFGGMVFAAISLEHLSGIFSAIDVGKRGVVALRDAELAMVVRYPQSASPALATGSRTAAPELRRRVAGGETAGTYLTVQLADQIERTVSFRKIADYPFYVVVGLARDEYQAGSYRDAVKLAALVLFFAVVTLLAAWAINLAWTRQQRLRLSLQESQSRLTELFENMGSGVVVYRPAADGKGLIIDAFNRAAEHIEQVRREDVVGKDVLEAFPAVADFGLLDVLRRVAQSGTAERFPVSFYHDSRVAGWRDNYVYRLPGGEVVAIYDDVTERKQMEEALRQSEAYNKLLFADSRVPMVVIDTATGRYVDCNQAAVEVYGLPGKEAVLGLTPADVSAATQYDGSDSGEAVRSKLEQAMTHGSAVFEWSHRRPSGELWDARVHLMRIRMGTHVFLLFNLQDITAEKQAGDELRSKTEALQRSNADLERFAYSVSHDMRQPLRAISGHLQLLQLSLDGKLDDDERANLEFALDGSRRMDSMIVSLLDYSRVGRKTESKKWMASKESLDEALEFLEPAILQAGAEVAVSGEWPRVFASRDELTRLFQNLVGNALHYHEPGQVPRVEVVSEATAHNWRVSVRDHGIGINPQHIDRLFQFFSRLQARSRFEGTGMGLALCRRIVEHHHGRIWAESAGEGQGSAFIFELPLNQESSNDSA